ncbi:hypothetical protein PV326_004847, partial [Microctonus aethiopoides]
MAFLRTIPCCNAGKKMIKCLTSLAANNVNNNLYLNKLFSVQTTHMINIYNRNYSLDVGQKNNSTIGSTKSTSRQIDPLDLRFNDPVASFKSKTTLELIRAYIVYQICSIEYVVENNMKFMRFANKILGERLFKMFMKATFYGHFVAGEDENEIRPVLDRLRQFGVKPILDYSVEEDMSQEEAERREVQASVSEAGDETKEGTIKKYHVEKSFADRRYKVSSARTYFYLNEASCERNMDIFIRCLEAVAAGSKNDGIIAVKLTALGRPQLLPDVLKKKFEEAHIRDEVPVKKFLEKIQSDKEGVIHLFPWSGILDENYQLSETFQVPDIKTGKMVKLMTQLTRKEEEMFRNMIRRLNNIVAIATKLNVRIMIDAEQTYFQPAISRLTLEMMRKYNTERTYLKDAYNEVKTDLEQAERQNFYFGAKIVRGAYIEQERARAAAMSYSDPTCANYEATTENYHKTLMECLRRMKQYKDKGEDPKKLAIMVASHNEDTVRFAIEKMKEIGISPEDKVICFGQLFAMCDYLTFPLGQSGYSAYKYIPYGPVKEVLPYLSRRAQENRG